MIETSEPAQQYYRRHVTHPSTLTLQECLAISDVVISAVPSAAYKVKTEWLKDGCICVNVAADKNFEKDVRDKVRQRAGLTHLLSSLITMGRRQSTFPPSARSLYLCSCETCMGSNSFDDCVQ